MDKLTKYIFLLSAFIKNSESTENDGQNYYRNKILTKFFITEEDLRKIEPELIICNKTLEKTVEKINNILEKITIYFNIKCIREFLCPAYSYSSLLTLEEKYQLY